MLLALGITDEVDVEARRVDYDGLVEGGRFEHWQHVRSLVLQPRVMLGHTTLNYLCSQCNISKASSLSKQTMPCIRYLV